MRIKEKDILKNIELFNNGNINPLINNFYEMSTFILGRKKVGKEHFDDILQEMVLYTISRVHKFNPKKGKAFSFFYRQLYLHMIYELRKIHNKHKFDTIDYDKMRNYDKYNESIEKKSQEMIKIENLGFFPKEEVVKAAKKAKNLLKRLNNKDKEYIIKIYKKQNILVQYALKLHFGEING